MAALISAEPLELKYIGAVSLYVSIELYYLGILKLHCFFSKSSNSLFKARLLPQNIQEPIYCTHKLFKFLVTKNFVNTKLTVAVQVNCLGVLLGELIVKVLEGAHDLVKEFDGRQDGGPEVVGPGSLAEATARNHSYSCQEKQGIKIRLYINYGIWIS